MEWVANFYATQGVLLPDESDTQIQPHHRDIAASTIALAVPPPARVLELGAGRGYVAGALADLGYDVVANELVPALAAKAQEIAGVQRRGTMTVLLGNFHEIDLDGKFDIVCYWDGFGIGADADQRMLLRRVHDWLLPDGQALIEIYTPWYWAQAAGRTMAFGHATRRYGYDSHGNRMLDTWWSIEDPANTVTQSLRCYSPADLDLLLEGTGLRRVAITPGGCYNATTDHYEIHVPLGQSISYVATLAPVR